MLKVAHREYHWLNKEDVGSFHSYTKRGLVFPMPLKADKLYDQTDFEFALRRYYEDKFPGGRYSKLWNEIFLNNN